MSREVRVTEEQAKSLRLINDICDESLANFTLLKIVDFINNGYEVEEQYKVGDWVVFEPSEFKMIGKLIRIDLELMVKSSEFGVPQSVPLDELRHANKYEIETEKDNILERKIIDNVPKLNSEEKEILLRYMNTLADDRN